MVHVFKLGWSECLGGDELIESFSCIAPLIYVLFVYFVFNMTVSKLRRVYLNHTLSGSHLPSWSQRS
jgi:hypothetical protein